MSDAQPAHAGPPDLKARGVLVLRREPETSFLLMRKPGRWDVPKGHLDAGETDVQCALRELAEETGISADDLELDERFCFRTQYLVRNRRIPDRDALKELLLYLGWLKHDVPIRLTEHVAYEWRRWDPPHRIQEETIDPLLAEVAEHLRRSE